MILYVYDGYRGNRSASPGTEMLVRESIRRYAEETGIPMPVDANDADIARTHKGKPYIPGTPVHFSVSHSDNYWVCLVGPTENGIDIQNNKHKNYEAIAKRFFQPMEQQAVEIGGLPYFMAIWSRKEAFIKYNGSSIGDTIDWLDVSDQGKPADQVEYNHKTIIFTEINVHPDYICVAATEKKEQIWIRKIAVV
jgi:4'-phosphopantetheinyl transferase